MGWKIKDLFTHGPLNPPEDDDATSAATEAAKAQTKLADDQWAFYQQMFAPEETALSKQAMAPVQVDSALNQVDAAMTQADKFRQETTAREAGRYGIQLPPSGAATPATAPRQGGGFVNPGVMARSPSFPLSAGRGLLGSGLLPQSGMNDPRMQDKNYRMFSSLEDKANLDIMRSRVNARNAVRRRAPELQTERLGNVIQMGQGLPTEAVQGLGAAAGNAFAMQAAKNQSMMGLGQAAGGLLGAGLGSQMGPNSGPINQYGDWRQNRQTSRLGQQALSSDWGASLADPWSTV
jgi:hypothetical protein